MTKPQLNVSSSSSNKPKIKDLKLNLLLDVTKAINNNLSTEKLLNIYRDFLKDQLSIGKLVLFTHDSRWKCILRYGINNDFDQLDVEKELLRFSEITTIGFSAESKLLNKHFEIVIPIFHKAEPLAYLLIGDLEDKIEVSPTIKHLPFIQTLTNIIIVAIENKKLAKENIRQATIKKELELASEMQSMLFPTALPNDDKLEISGFYQPHQQVGGDYYDFIRLNENEVAFCVADVSGKGVAAALLMSNFQANLRVLFNHTSSLTELLHELNTKVMGSAKGEKFITLFIAKYNLITRVLTYINAGHNPPLLASGTTISMLKIGSTGLGMFDEIKKVKEGIVNIPPNSTIVCYTDGVVELENENGEEFGVNEMKNIIIENSDLSMRKLNLRIMEKLIEFKGNNPYIDDIALFSCRIY